MRPGKDLIGKPVYSIKDGRLMGSVKDLFVDFELNVVSGIYLGSEGLFSRKITAILRDDIQVFGIDSVLAASSDVVTDSAETSVLETWLRREDLQGRNVDTPGGTKVGNIGDLLLDEDARIVGYWLSKVRVAGPVAEHRQVMNDAIIDTGDKDGTMTIDLSKAEQPTTEPQASSEEPEKTAGETGDQPLTIEMAEESVETVEESETKELDEAEAEEPEESVEEPESQEKAEESSDSDDEIEDEQQE